LKEYFLKSTDLLILQQNPNEMELHGIFWSGAGCTGK